MFAVDIDGTIAEGEPAALLDYFRETCRLALLDVPEDITWWDVFDLPEVVAYRKLHRKRYQRIRENVTGSLLVLRACTPVPGAVAQLRWVSQREELKYVTIRGDDLPSQKTTHAWLAQLGFPNSDSVVFCRSFFQKIAQVMREPGEHVIIDDRYTQLVEALHEVEEQAGDDHRYRRMIEGARRRLTIVAFGATALAEQDLFPGVHTVALPSWDQFEECCGALLREPIERGV